MPKFSVIMPAFNRALFISRAIFSVLNQDCITAPEIELLVIDDGSTDTTPEVVQNMIKQDRGESIEYIRVTHIGEPGTVRNIGLRQAKGEYIAYCDSDDFWLPHHLATANQAFIKDSSLGMVSNYWGLAQFTPTQNGIRSDIVVPVHPTWAVNTNCRVHRKDCIATVGFFNEKRWGEDGDFFTKIENNFKHRKTGIVTSINGYIKGGNNLSYQFDAGIKSRYF